MKIKVKMYFGDPFFSLFFLFIRKTLLNDRSAKVSNSHYRLDSNKSLKSLMKHRKKRFIEEKGKQESFER